MKLIFVYFLSEGGFNPRNLKNLILNYFLPIKAASVESRVSCSLFLCLDRLVRLCFLCLLLELGLGLGLELGLGLGLDLELGLELELEIKLDLELELELE